MLGNKQYLIVIPALNEETTIGSVIDAACQDIPQADILVVDDGSSDETSAIARERQAMVVRHPFNLGYGAALQTGFRFADHHSYDFVITIDADGQHLPFCAKSLIETMQHQNADVVIGSRFLEGKYRAGIARTIGIRLFSFIAKIYTGVKITDPTSGFQLLRKTAFSHLSLADNYPLDYPDVNIIMSLHKRNFKIAEAPVTMKQKTNEQSMHRGFRPVFYVIRMLLAIILVIVGGKGKR
jgi:glycosyltransferase involved in cell wall biosynthesis